jgi:hypothetical protein
VRGITLLSRSAHSVRDSAMEGTNRNLSAFSEDAILEISRSIVEEHEVSAITFIFIFLTHRRPFYRSDGCQEFDTAFSTVLYARGPWSLL